MSNIVDRVFAEVCLDERIADGIFRLEEEEHMNALRDYFVKKGITQEAAVHVTNRMVEGRFPERQAYNKDGILVTFPTPQHKQRAIKRGTHFEKNPAPQAPPREEPKKEVPPPSKEKELPPKEEPSKAVPKPEAEEPPKKVTQGEKELEVEPPRGTEKPETPPVPQSPTPPPAPRTPERVAAEKEVVKQILATDDTALSPVAPNLKEVGVGNPELENKIRIMRNTLVDLIDSLPYEKLKSVYDRLMDDGDLWRDFSKKIPY